MRRRDFITSLGAAAVFSGCSGSAMSPAPRGTSSAPGTSLNLNSASTTRAYAITGFMRDREASSTILSIDVATDAMISALALPYTGGLGITMNRGGTFVYASQSPQTIPGRGNGPFPLIHRFSQETLSIVHTFFLPTAGCGFPIELWEIALDPTESALWIAYGQNGVLRLDLHSGNAHQYVFGTSKAPLDVRCAAAGNGVTYVAGRNASGGGTLIAVDSSSGAKLRTAILPNALRPNYIVLSEDLGTLYIGADTPPSAPNAFDGVSFGLVYDAQTFSIRHQQSFSSPQGAGAGGMAVNPVSGWVLFGYQFFLGVQYLPSTSFFDTLGDFFDGSGVAFTQDGKKAYASQGLPAHVGVYMLREENGKTEWHRTSIVSGTPNLFNEHVLAITMN